MLVCRVIRNFLFTSTSIIELEETRFVTDQVDSLRIGEDTIKRTATMTLEQRLQEPSCAAGTAPCTKHNNPLCWSKLFAREFFDDPYFKDLFLTSAEYISRVLVERVYLFARVGDRIYHTCREGCNAKSSMVRGRESRLDTQIFALIRATIVITRVFAAILRIFRTIASAIMSADCTIQSPTRMYKHKYVHEFIRILLVLIN